MNYAMRTDRDSRQLLLDELRQGRLRQGWGYVSEQNLNSVAAKVKNGDPLSARESSAWRNWRMLGGKDGFCVGTRLLLPNMPSDGRFMLVEVTGGYEFSMLSLPGGEKDYGHVLPVKGPTPPDRTASFSYRDARVPAALRQSLRCQSRIWSLAEYGTALGQLWDEASQGREPPEPSNAGFALRRVYKAALGAVRDQLQSEFLRQLEGSFQAAELEQPCQVLLQRIFPDADVERTAGPAERGADLVVKWEDPLARVGAPTPLSWQIVVQVKCWSGEATDTTAIDQIKTAYRHYGPDGAVRAGIVMTLCSRESGPFKQHREEVGSELKIPIMFIDRHRLVELFLQYGLQEAVDE